MPSGYLHQCCAERACSLSGVTPVEKHVMTLGAQGPDPLFVMGIFPLRMKNTPGKLGHLLHSYRTGAFLRALCRMAKASGAVLRAYALGFLTHYALDSTVHPYVYAHSLRPDGRYSSSMHMSLEKSWDILFYRRDGRTGTPIIMPGVQECQAHWPAIAALLQAAIQDAFAEVQVPVQALEKALSDAAYADRLTHSPHGVKYRIVWLLERVIGKPGLATSQMVPTKPMQGDITNEARLPWANPSEPERQRDEGLEELFEQGIRRSAELLSAASDYFNDMADEEALSAVIGDVGYDTGLQSKQDLPEGWQYP